MFTARYELGLQIGQIQFRPLKVSYGSTQCLQGHHCVKCKQSSTVLFIAKTNVFVLTIKKLEAVLLHIFLYILIVVGR